MPHHLAAPSAPNQASLPGWWDVFCVSLRRPLALPPRAVHLVGTHTGRNGRRGDVIGSRRPRPLPPLPSSCRCAGPASSDRTAKASCGLGAVDDLRSDVVGTSLSATCLAEHRVELGVGHAGCRGRVSTMKQPAGGRRRGSSSLRWTPGGSRRAPSVESAALPARHDEAPETSAPHCRTHATPCARGVHGHDGRLLPATPRRDSGRATSTASSGPSVRSQVQLARGRRAPADLHCYPDDLRGCLVPAADLSAASPATPSTTLASWCELGVQGHAGSAPVSEIRPRVTGSQQVRGLTSHRLHRFPQMPGSENFGAWSGSPFSFARSTPGIE
jgi:hypothetical protein